jgi:hypothetical protein
MGQVFHLADGRLIDNSGVVMLQVASALAAKTPSDPLQQLRTDLVIASDGSALPLANIGAQHYKSYDSTSEGIGSAIDTIYAFSGAPYADRISTQQILSMSARRIIADPTVDHLLDGPEFKRRFTSLSSTDQNAIISMLAEGSSQPEMFGSGDLRKPVYPQKINEDAVLKDIKLLLQTYRNTKTLDSRIGARHCRRIFRFGRILTVLLTRELMQLDGMRP